MVQFAPWHQGPIWRLMPIKVMEEGKQVESLEDCMLPLELVVVAVKIV